MQRLEQLIEEKNAELTRVSDYLMYISVLSCHLDICYGLFDEIR